MLPPSSRGGAPPEIHEDKKRKAKLRDIKIPRNDMRISKLSPNQGLFSKNINMGDLEMSSRLRFEPGSNLDTHTHTRQYWYVYHADYFVPVFQKRSVRMRLNGCHARFTLARAPWRAHITRVPGLRQRQSFSRTLLSQIIKKKTVE